MLLVQSSKQFKHILKHLFVGRLGYLPRIVDLAESGTPGSAVPNRDLGQRWSHGSQSEFIITPSGILGQGTEPVLLLGCRPERVSSDLSRVALAPRGRQGNLDALWMQSIYRLFCRTPRLELPPLSGRYLLLAATQTRFRHVIEEDELAAGASVQASIQYDEAIEKVIPLPLCRGGSVH